MMLNYHRTLRLGGRPLRVTLPFVRAGAEGPHVRLFELAFVFQVKIEEGQFDLCAEPFAGVHAEADVAQRIARPARPAAVRPRPHHQRVLRAGVVLFDG